MEAEKIWFDHSYIYLETKNKRKGKMPLDWFPKLKKAELSDLEKYELWAENSWIHWEKLGEDLSVDGFFTYKK